MKHFHRYVYGYCPELDEDVAIKVKYVSSKSEEYKKVSYFCIPPFGTCGYCLENNRRCPIYEELPPEPVDEDYFYLNE